MKIGIVTYHRTLNYGACLQAIATRIILESMGHEVYYVDYWPDYHREMYQLLPKRKFRKLGFLQKIKFVLKLLKHYKSQKLRIENFETFFKSQIYPYCRPVDDTFDVVIYGSDQIWRKQKSLGTYNPFYFGENIINTKRHVSYAASMGALPDNNIDKEKVKALVTHFEKISVREENLRQFLLSLGFKNVFLSLDPTLLLSSEEWDKFLPTEVYRGEKYILVYIMGSNSFNLNEIKKFADRKGLKTIVLRGYAKTKESATNITSAGPLEFIRLIKNAEYVFSASFHGLAFSIIYGKQFFTSFISNAGRAKSLLDLIGYTERLLEPKGVIPQDLSPVNYDEVAKRMKIFREESLKYLADIK